MISEKRLLSLSGKHPLREIESLLEFLDPLHLSLEVGHALFEMTEGVRSSTPPSADPGLMAPVQRSIDGAIHAP